MDKCEIWLTTYFSAVPDMCNKDRVCCHISRDVWGLIYGPLKSSTSCVVYFCCSFPFIGWQTFVVRCAVSRNAPVLF
jgi:hypothetical protein